MLMKKIFYNNDYKHLDLCGRTAFFAPTKNLHQTMKKFLLGAVALTLMFTACKKDDENGTPANTFKVGATTYTTSTVQTTGNIVIAGGTNGTAGGSITFSFPGSAAPVAGTYRVVENATAANQVEFLAAGGTTGYASTGVGTVDAVVSFDGTKIKISMPDAPAKDFMGGTAEVMVNANITGN